MFENPRRGRQARNFTTNVPKILDLKSSSEQMFSENWRYLLKASNRGPEIGNEPSQPDRAWIVEWICFVNSLAIGPELMKPTYPSEISKGNGTWQNNEIEIALSSAILLGETGNCILIVLITKPNHCPTCIGSNFDFSLFNFKHSISSHSDAPNEQSQKTSPEAPRYSRPNKQINNGSSNANA